MLFNSLEFFLFFIVVYGLYRVIDHSRQNWLLLGASYFFYGCWDWRFLGLIWASTFIDYICGQKIAKASSKKQKKQFLTLSVASNLGILGFFKYFNFFQENLIVLGNSVGWQINPLTLQIILPVGISFYTFQSMSYTIDIYRGLLKPEKDLRDFALYVAFFPQLVAGPIERARNLLPQITKKRKTTKKQFNEGIWLIFWGLYKKIFIADNLAPIVDTVFNKTGTFSGAEVLLATYAFAFQIYCDFSGYSNIARGLAKLMGIELMLNFKFPYFVTNPRDFWRNWHISLSTWLKDYLYIPLGGNKKGDSILLRNLLITMLLGGLWHGAAWPFVIWGAYQGALLIGHRLVEPSLQWLKFTSVLGQKAWFVLRWLVMFHLTCLGWLIFRSQSLEQLNNMLTNLVFNFEIAAGQGLGVIVPIIATIWFLCLVKWYKFKQNDMLAVLKLPSLAKSFVFLIIFYSIIWYGAVGGKEFIYFQF